MSESTQDPRQPDEEPVEDLEAPADAQEDVAGGMPCSGATCAEVGGTCVKTAIY